MGDNIIIQQYVEYMQDCLLICQSWLHDRRCLLVAQVRRTLTTATALATNICHHELEFGTKPFAHAAVDDKVDGGINHQEEVAKAQHDVKRDGHVEPAESEIYNVHVCHISVIQLDQLTCPALDIVRDARMYCDLGVSPRRP